MNRLLNKTAVITGGNSGIGLATAKEFIAEGARVIITGRNQSALDKALKELGPDASGIISDSSDLKAIRSLGEQVSAVFPAIDILFINAGIAKFAPIEAVDEAHFDEQFNVNVKGAYFTIQQLLPSIKEGGSIILNTSVNAHIGMPNASIYSATKAAQLTLIRTLSAEFLSRKIRVNAISPGPITTPLYNKLGIPADQLEQTAAGIKNLVPIGRFGTPDEIAKIAVFFASDDSSFVLGAELIAAGGLATL
jgi:NAD(P)-dependent dehydrogenase (short-subunit alcohol dehydrogenase family)